MSLSEQERAFFAWLDEVPCTGNGVLVRTPKGETRNVSRDAVAGEFRSRWQARSRESFARLERAKNLTALFGALIEKEERLWA
jgi:hypothetical protein